MEESPIAFDELNLRRIPKGTLVICANCGAPTHTGVEILLAENEGLLCGDCVDRAHLYGN